jgi:hypothetical protein
MAILVEEEKKPVNWIGMLTTIFIVVAVFVLAYFLFFKTPQIIDQVTPKNLADINKISKINFDPNAVINSPTFNALKNEVPVFTPRETPGKQNPFRP